MNNVSSTYFAFHLVKLSQWLAIVLLVGYIGLINPDVQAHSQDDILSELTINKAQFSKTWGTYNFAYDTAQSIIRKQQVYSNLALFQQALYSFQHTFFISFWSNQQETCVFDDHNSWIMKSLGNHSRELPHLSS